MKDDITLRCAFLSPMTLPSQQITCTQPTSNVANGCHTEIQRCSNVDRKWDFDAKHVAATLCRLSCNVVFRLILRCSSVAGGYRQRFSDVTQPTCNVANGCYMAIQRCRNVDRKWDFDAKHVAATLRRLSCNVVFRLILRCSRVAGGYRKRFSDVTQPTCNVANGCQCGKATLHLGCNQVGFRRKTRRSNVASTQLQRCLRVDLALQEGIDNVSATLLNQLATLQMGVRAATQRCI